MTPLNPHCHETVTLRRQLDAAERELEHRAEVAATQADRYARLRLVAIRRAERIESLERGRVAAFIPFGSELLEALGSARHLASPRSTCFPSPEDHLA